MHAKRPAEAPTDPVLTPRLVLTPVGPDDVNDLLLLSSDPVVAYWTGPWTRAAVEAWAADMAARWTADGVGKWMARDRSDGSLVGRGGFTRFDLDGETVLELGWAVRDARTGRGYATELGRAAWAWRPWGTTAWAPIWRFMAGTASPGRDKVTGDSAPLGSARPDSVPWSLATAR